MGSDVPQVARVFVQFGEAAGEADPSVRYRDGFREYVSARGNPARDRIVYVEPNPYLSSLLRGEWIGWPHLEVLNVDSHPCPGGVAARNFYWAEEDAPLFLTFLPSRESVRRRFPNGTIRTTPVPCASLAGVIQRVGGGMPIALLSMDLRRESIDEIRAVDWASARCEAVSLARPGLGADELGAADEALRSAGFRRAGRAWGDAGTSRLYRRSDSAVGAVQASFAQARVLGGQAVVGIRDGWLNPETRRALTLKARVALDPAYSASDVLDATYGRTLQPMPRTDVDRLLPDGYGVQRSAWSVLLEGEPDPWDLASECAARHGLWPISFSYPRRPLPLSKAPADLISPIVPGFPYSFEDEGEYLAAYQSAYLGLTHRKAGWDCFRHVEILASGALPFMLDADEIPGYSMVHYPKQAFRRVRERVLASGGPPDDATRRAFRAFFERHLTSAAMARYLLNASGLAGASRVLFVDERLPVAADYQSVLTLIGLKQVLGQGCDVRHPVDYVYEDSAHPSASLYGRGFGYTRVLPAELRSSGDRAIGPASKLPDLSEFDAIVVGSVSRNADVADDLLQRFPASRTIWIHGEDSPPTIDEARRLRQSGAHVFVRSIYTPIARHGRLQSRR